MAIDLTQKLVPAVGYIQLKNADGSLMADEQGNGAFARVHSPSSKVYEQAFAARRRKTLKRVRENGGKLEAGQEQPEDIVEFLIAITEEFIGVEVPLPEGETGAKAMVRAIYSNPALGFIRDQMDAAAGDWGAFLGKLPTTAASSPASLPG